MCDINACPVGSSRTGCGGDKVGNCTLWYRPRIYKIEGSISGVSATNGGATLRISADYIGKETTKLKHVRFFYGLETNINAFLQQDTNSSLNVGNLTNKIFEARNCRVIKEDTGDELRARKPTNQERPKREPGMIQCTTGEGVGANLVGYLQVGENWTGVDVTITTATSSKINAVQKSNIFNANRISYAQPIIYNFNGTGSGIGTGASSHGGEPIYIYGENFGT
jgi:hypothetical protein